MATTAHLLRINVVELLRHPGATRRVEAAIDPHELGVDDDRVAGEISIDLAATSSVDGVVVHGTVRTPWHGQCRRCLIDVSGVAEIEVEELFQHDPRHQDAVAIVGDQIDLAPIVREYVLLDLPEHPLCRPDCAGICAQCGADRNVTSCDCEQPTSDPRWSALEGLQLDAPEPDPE
jgi:uncharacterized protein